jgi:glycosidase
MAGPLYPSLYEVNTRLMMTDLSQKLGRMATLDDIPEVSLDGWQRQGFDWIYLLGVWQTGPASRAVSRSNPQWRREFESELDDLRDSDICGSCFAVTAYTVHADLGGDGAMERLQQRMHQHGLQVMLDFVPNHTGLGHRWVREHPEFYVAGSEDDLSAAPESYIRVGTRQGDRVVAYGRDPYFPGWPDTLQLNYGKPEVQAAMLGELEKVAALADGARCDMAMLILPEIFQRTWGISMQPFWPAATQRIHEQHSGFVFMAEVYWDLEWTLQQQGFDYTYDKRLYDRLRDQYARAIREHLGAEPAYQRRLARFLENHDETRAAAAFADNVHQAAAVVTFLSPGLRFFHDGQLEGKQRHTSVHLCRGPYEEANLALQEFYRRLLGCVSLPAVREGEWQLLDSTQAWDGNWTSDCFIAFAWRSKDQRLLVVVNYAVNQSQCFVRLPFEELRGANVRLRDLMDTPCYDRQGDVLLDRGLFVDLPPWGYNVFDVQKLEQ